jgi:hypothetical protein
MADFVSAAPFLAEWEPASRRPEHPAAPRLARNVAELFRATPERDCGRQTVHAATTPRAPGAPARPPAIALFLDVPPRLGLAVGRRLLGAGWAVAPLYARWPVRHAVLPVERLVSWMAGGGSPAGPGRRPLEAEGTRPVRLCLLLDGERHWQVSPAILRRRFDNRYDYLAHMLPPAARLRHWGVVNVQWIGRTAGAPADLDAYAGSLVAAGLSAAFASVAQLCGP